MILQALLSQFAVNKCYVFSSISIEENCEEKRHFYFLTEFSLLHVYMGKIDASCFTHKAVDTIFHKKKIIKKLKKPNISQYNKGVMVSFHNQD